MLSHNAGSKSSVLLLLHPTVIPDSFEGVITEQEQKREFPWLQDAALRDYLGSKGFDCTLLRYGPAPE